MRYEHRKLVHTFQYIFFTIHSLQFKYRSITLIIVKFLCNKYGIVPTVFYV